MTRGLLALGFASVIAAGTARPAWAGTKVIDQAHALAQRWGVTPKEVTTGPAHRRVKRLFLPVTEQMRADVEHTFTTAIGGTMLHTLEHDPRRHTTLLTKPRDLFFWGVDVRLNPHVFRMLRQVPYRFDNLALGGWMIPLDLSDVQNAHVRSWLAAEQQRQAYGRNALGCETCMDWLSRLEVAPGQNLPNHLGIHRSRDGGMLKARILYAADEKVPVVLRIVQSIHEFNVMHETTLLGPPGGSVEDHVHTR
jgi:hypothetical protein